MKGLRESIRGVIKKLKEETEYQKFFTKALKKYGKKSPAEMSDEEKKEFFDYVDRNWKAAHEESVEKVAEDWEGRAIRVGKSHVIEIFPTGGKLYDKEGVATMLSMEQLKELAKKLKETNVPLTEGLHMFSGNIMITKKKVLPLLKKMGISKVKLKSVGGLFMDIYFDADDKKFKEIQQAFAKNFGKPGSSSWKNLNMSLENVKTRLSEKKVQKWPNSLVNKIYKGLQRQHRSINSWLSGEMKKLQKDASKKHGFQVFLSDGPEGAKFQDAYHDWSKAADELADVVYDFQAEALEEK
jgi:hypothetical protein